MQIDRLREFMLEQSQDGVWDQDRYSHGFTNGLIHALSILEDVVPKYKKEPRKYVKKKLTKPRLFDQHDVDLILEYASAGLSQNRIARKFGCSQTTISKIVHGNYE